MTAHLDVNEPQFARAAAAILERHERNEPEANITSAVRDVPVLIGPAVGASESRRRLCPGFPRSAPC